ncbi:type VI secretion system tip protein VgrG [Andreprevotia chitinilytica]|uniref:type VI secretion system tip protein VgrG n=1 Tax=Andreprevotia chitinilytica TaxID=396808 RepID=UPI00068EB628|nr:type VI secretion system tip protein VgrG [Andreprevotia chitinilytica]
MQQRYFLDLPRCTAPLSVQSFAGTEALGQPYSITIHLTSPNAALPLLALLDQPAAFSIRPATALTGIATIDAQFPPVQALRQWHGVVRGFDRVSSSADETTYRVVIEPRLARLANHIDTRLWQNQSLPGVIEQVLREQGGLSGADFVFQLTGDFPVQEHITQYRESGLTFIRRLCETAGIWFGFTQQDDRDVVHFGNDLTHYTRIKTAVPLRATAGLESPEQTEALHALQVHTQPAPACIQQQDYNYRTASQPLLSETAASSDRPGHVGQQYLWGDHPKTPTESQTATRLRFEAGHAQQVVATGDGNVVTFAPGHVFHTDSADALSEQIAEHGWLIVAIEHTASRGQAYVNHFTAIPADRVYRLPVETPKPKIAGTIPARVTSPNRYQYAFLDEHGRYRVTFNFDQSDWPAAGSSRPVRLAKPYAGDTYGLHFPLIDGTEVQIAFQNGDIDRPYIAHALHDSRHPDHVTNHNHTRNIIRTPANNKLRLEDENGKQHIKLATEYGKSQLNLGHLVDQTRQQRGAGFELRTDEWGAIRAGKGILISTDAQAKAGGKQLDMAEVTTHLQRALEQMQALADAAQFAQAFAADINKQKDLLEARLQNLQQAVLLMHAPAGVAMTSDQQMQLSAGDNLIATAGGNIDLGSVGQTTLAAGKGVSLYAQQQGMKLFAGKGKVEMQAQSDAMDLIAEQDLTLISSDGKISITAPKEITLSAGGAYIKLKDGNIEIACPGGILNKSASWQKQGPAQALPPIPELPKSGPHARKFGLMGLDGILLAGAAATVYGLEDGKKIWSEKTDRKGQTPLFETGSLEKYIVELGFDGWSGLFGDTEEPEDEDEEPYDPGISDERMDGEPEDVDPLAFLDTLADIGSAALHGVAEAVLWHGPNVTAGDLIRGGIRGGISAIPRPEVDEADQSASGILSKAGAHALDGALGAATDKGTDTRFSDLRNSALRDGIRGGISAIPRPEIDENDQSASGTLSNAGARALDGALNAAADKTTDTRMGDLRDSALRGARDALPKPATPAAGATPPFVPDPPKPEKT